MAGLSEKMIIEYFKTKEITSTILDDYFKVSWNIEGTSIDVFFFLEDDTHVHLRGINFVKIPENAFEKMYKLVNDINNLYNWVKFIVDVEHETIVARIDAVIHLDSCGEECYELMVSMLNVVEQAYPKIMKAIWA